jgi:hypothetical protein
MTVVFTLSFTDFKNKKYIFLPDASLNGRIVFFRSTPTLPPPSTKLPPTAMATFLGYPHRQRYKKTTMHELLQRKNCLIFLLMNLQHELNDPKPEISYFLNL